MNLSTFPYHGSGTQLVPNKCLTLILLKLPPHTQALSHPSSDLILTTNPTGGQGDRGPYFSDEGN